MRILLWETIVLVASSYVGLVWFPLATIHEHIRPAQWLYPFFHALNMGHPFAIGAIVWMLISMVFCYKIYSAPEGIDIPTSNWPVANFFAAATFAGPFGYFVYKWARRHLRYHFGPA